MRSAWSQGEHVVLIGPTGSGKTTLLRDMLAIRGYVVVIAVKPKDDTTEQFRKAGYKIITKWPPRYDCDRCVVWIKPKDLGDIGDQRDRVFEVMRGVYRAAGYALVLDDSGYITGFLNLAKPVAQLLNTARSSRISTVCVTTQPTSLAARIPSEIMRQTRHKIVFAMDNEDDIKAIARLTGHDRRRLEVLMDQLGEHDFLAFSHRRVTLVRNTRR